MMVRGLVVPARGGLIWRLALVLALVLALLGGIAPGPAAAATLQVQSGADGGGSCPGASCTLRQAVADANAGDTITFAPAITTVTLTTAELAITKNLTIQGSGMGGVRVERSAAGGTPRFRIFNIGNISGGVVVTLRGLTIANGDVEGDGGGIKIEGGGLTLESSVMTGNTARAASSGGGTRGGGIAANNAPVMLTGSTLSSNEARAEGSSGSAFGGGIYGTVGGITLTDSTLENNAARAISTGTSSSFGGSAFGGGLYVAIGGIGVTLSAPVTLTRSTLRGNSARAEGAADYFSGSAYGGGLYASASGIDVTLSAPVTLTDSTLENNAARAISTGTGTSFNGYVYGGGLYAYAGGINATASAPVLLTGSTLDGNEARAEGVADSSFSGSAYGGGVYGIGGDLTLTGSALDNNAARAVSTGTSTYFSGYAYGGGAYTAGAVTLTEGSTLSGNEARAEGAATSSFSGSAYGGGAYAYGGGLALTDSTLDNNAARAVSTGTSTYFNGYASGGGTYASINSYQGTVSAPTTLTGSSVSGNEARIEGAASSSFSGNAYGGGLYFSVSGFDATISAPMTLANTTLSGNAARLVPTGTGSYSSSYAYGGGIYASAFGFGGTVSAPVSLDHATLADNTASHPTTADGHQLYLTGTSATVARSVFAHGAPPATGNYFVGGVTSGGYNVSQYALPGAIGTDLVNTDPKLAPLGNYGGATQTRALLVGSPAIDHVLAGAGCLATDQRGVTRPQPSGGACDSGAFESRGFTLTREGGDGQSAAINTAFAAPLRVRVVPGDAGVPVQGLTVSFAGPPSGAGIQGSPLTATTGTDGRASAPPTANGLVGGPYTVPATAAGVGGSASFSLTNVPAATTLAVDAATGVYTGTTTLRATLTATNGGAALAGKTIVFSLNGAAVCGGGGQPACPATNAQGVATLANVGLGSIGANTYATGVGASFAGDANYAGSTATAVLTVSKATTALSQVSGTATYGDTTGSLTATLRRTNGDGGPVVGATVQFTVNGAAAGSATTNAQGVATLPNGALPAGLNAGTYATAVGASFAGDANHLAAGPTRGPLTVARRILWLKPTDRTVGLKQPNPPTDPHQDAACAAPSWCLELARGSTFVSGQSWSALGLTNLRFQYSRNPPSTNAAEKVGSTYRITAFGATSGNYDIRYDPGTMTVR